MASQFSAPSVPPSFGANRGGTSGVYLAYNAHYEALPPVGFFHLVCSFPMGRGFRVSGPCLFGPTRHRLPGSGPGRARRCSLGQGGAPAPGPDPWEINLKEAVLAQAGLFFAPESLDSSSPFRPMDGEAVLGERCLTNFYKDVYRIFPELTPEERDYLRRRLHWTLKWKPRRDMPGNGSLSWK
jgi:hypothetical protein